MGKLEHWIIAARKADTLSPELCEDVMALGGLLGSSWEDAHQHVCVNQYNKEDIEALLCAAGCTVSYVSEKPTLHPELHPKSIYHRAHSEVRPENMHCIIASRMLAVLDPETVQAILEAGGQIGGGWCEVHQHIHVHGNNVDAVAKILRAADIHVSVCPWEVQSEEEDSRD